MNNKIREAVREALENIAETMQILSRKMAQQVKNADSYYAPTYERWAKAMSRITSVISKYF